MIHIVTKWDKNNVIRDSESFFKKYISTVEFDPFSNETLERIDSAVVLDKKLGTIRTRFGVTDIHHLSTGCKIVLSYLYLRKNREKFGDRVLDITECGGNALEVLFDFVERLADNESIFLLRQATQLFTFQDIPACVNGNICDSLYEGVVMYG